MLLGSASDAAASNVERRVRKGLLWLWENETGPPVAMSGVTEPAHGIFRVNAVYALAADPGGQYRELGEEIRLLSRRSEQ